MSESLIISLSGVIIAAIRLLSILKFLSSNKYFDKSLNFFLLCIFFAEVFNNLCGVFGDNFTLIKLVYIVPLMIIDLNMIQN